MSVCAHRLGEGLLLIPCAGGAPYRTCLCAAEVQELLAAEADPDACDTDLTR